jgi:hypothetical protein
LQAITGIHDCGFGGLIVLFLGDLTQLPPVGGRVGTVGKDEANQKGYELYRAHFTNVIELTENRRLDETNPEAEILVSCNNNLVRATSQRQITSN